MEGHEEGMQGPGTWRAQVRPRCRLSEALGSLTLWRNADQKDYMLELEEGCAMSRPRMAQMVLEMITLYFIETKITSKKNYR